MGYDGRDGKWGLMEGVASGNGWKGWQVGYEGRGGKWELMEAVACGI